MAPFSYVSRTFFGIMIVEFMRTLLGISSKIHEISLVKFIFSLCRLWQA